MTDAQPSYLVSFGGDDSGSPPLRLPEGSKLCEELDINNSPLLFGCRTGICGTCLVRVEAGEVPPADADEQEMLEVYAPNSGLRLACQLSVRSDMRLSRPKAGS